MIQKIGSSTKGIYFMSISVLLIDKSEIVEKMLSHCLYYFSAKVFRIESWDEHRDKIKEVKPDILFVEWELKNAGQALALSIEEEIKPLPVVLLYRASSVSEINALPSEKLPHRLVKPFDPKILREKFTKLVPQMKDSKIHPFLQFPKKQSAQTETDLKENTKIPLPHPTENSSHQNKTVTSARESTESSLPSINSMLKTASPTNNSKPIEQGTDKPEPLSQKESLQKSEETTQTQELQSTTPIDKTQEIKTNTPIDKTQETKTNTPIDKTQEIKTNTPIDKTQETKTNIPIDKTQRIKTNTPTDKTQETKTSDLLKKTFPKKTLRPPEKEETKEFNIDENTQNALAPMAIKSSSYKKESHLKNENIELNEQDILKVLNKYKDTLEFQQLMEKTFSEQSANVVTKILQNDNVKEILESSLAEFKESKAFKAFVESEIKSYLKKQLPLNIKAVVEEEIKKIVGD